MMKLVIALLFLLVLSARANSLVMIVSYRCAPTKIIYDSLKAFAEHRAGIGVTDDDQQIVELIVSVNGTFSILRTTPSGTTCLIAAGNNWETTVIKKQGRPT